ncbi:MAG: ATP:Cob(I)alamin adenosyltransferase, partial [uncultured Rubrobacteraceae bacterium]
GARRRRRGELFPGPGPRGGGWGARGTPAGVAAAPLPRHGRRGDAEGRQFCRRGRPGARGPGARRLERPHGDTQGIRRTGREPARGASGRRPLRRAPGGAQPRHGRVRGGAPLRRQGREPPLRPAVRGSPQRGRRQNPFERV